MSSIKPALKTTEPLLFHVSKGGGMRSPIVLLSRLLFAIPLLSFGAYTIIHVERLARAAPSWLPLADNWVYALGVASLLMATAFISGRHVVLAARSATLLILFHILVFTLPAMWPGDDFTRPILTWILLSDVGLAAGALLLAHVYGRQEA